MASVFSLVEAEIAVKLGLSPEVKVPFQIDSSESRTTYIRLPAPGSDKLDLLECAKSCDIFGQGETIEEALENACSYYHMVAATQVSVRRMYGARGQLLRN